MTGNKIPEKGMDRLYSSVRQIMDHARDTAYRAANFAMVEAYWQIGRLIMEEEQSGSQRAEYGESLLSALSARLTGEYGTTFSARNLRHMRQFYRVFQKWNAVRSELTWTHYRLIMKAETEEARIFYLTEAIEGNWSTRTLERQMASLYHERLMMTGRGERPLVREAADRKAEVMQPRDIVKDPYVLEFLNLRPNTAFYEKELEQAIIDQLQTFLLELGKGFSFVGRQYRFSTDGGKHFYIDLVFYNYVLKCFMLIDLKAGELTHQDVGQMDMYVRYFEDRVRQESDGPTIGLILCTEKDRTIVKYSLLNESRQLFASKYKTYLPTEKQLRKEIEREREMIETEKGLRDEE